MSLRKMADAGVLAMPDECAGCGEEFVFGSWHIHHGWAHCANCGALYCIVDYDDDETYDGPTQIWTDEFMEAVSAFYDEYERSMMKSPERFDEFVEENYPELMDDE